MASFLISAGLFGRSWHLCVRFFVLLANIFVWCVRWDVLSMVRWALPKKRSKVSEGSGPVSERPAETECPPPRVVDRQPAFTPPQSVQCESCGGKGNKSDWPCPTCYQNDFEMDSAKRRIEALGWTVSREGDEWLATRGLRTAKKLYIEELADLVAKESDNPNAFAALEFEGWKINPAGGPNHSYLATRDGKQVIGETVHDVRRKIESGQFDENYIVGQSSVIIYDDHPMYGHVRKYWPSWVELHRRPGNPHMAELDSDQSGRKGHCGLMFTLTAGIAAREFRNLWDGLCVKFKANAQIATGRAAARHLPSELLKAGWSRDHTAETADGRSVCSDDPAAVAWNISGAVTLALGAFNDPWHKYFKELAKLLQERNLDFGTGAERDALVYLWNRRTSGQKEVIAIAEEVERRLGLVRDFAAQPVEPTEDLPSLSLFLASPHGEGTVR